MAERRPVSVGVALDPRTPVLVGAAAVQQRNDDPAAALEPVELMIAALERAGEDARAPDLLGARQVRIPRGFWGIRIPPESSRRGSAARARTPRSPSWALHDAAGVRRARSPQAGRIVS
jgi:hypothetical protein